MRAVFLLTFPLSPWSVDTAHARPQPVAATELPRARLLATGGTISNTVGGRLTAHELEARIRLMRAPTTRQDLTALQRIFTES